MRADWRPMDTAPRDGTVMFLAVRGEVWLGHWHDVPKEEWHLFEEDGEPLDPETEFGWNGFALREFPYGSWRDDHLLSNQGLEPTAWALPESGA